jgi:hypothetical protein
MADNPFQTAVATGKSPLDALGMLKPHDTDSSGKMFLKSPKGIIEAIISSNIADDDVASAIASFYLQCREFEMGAPEDEMMIWLQSMLAGWRGVNAAALVLALETSVGAISEIATTSALGLKGADDLAKRVRQNKERENKVEKGKVQD